MSCVVRSACELSRCVDNVAPQDSHQGVSKTDIWRVDFRNGTTDELRRPVSTAFLKVWAGHEPGLEYEARVYAELQRREIATQWPHFLKPLWSARDCQEKNVVSILTKGLPGKITAAAARKMLRRLHESALKLHKTHEPVVPTRALSMPQTRAPEKTPETGSQIRSGRDEDEPQQLSSSTWSFVATEPMPARVEDLLDVLMDRKLDFAVLVSLWTQIAATLECMRSLKLVHGDLHPRNVFVLELPEEVEITYNVLSRGRQIVLRTRFVAIVYDWDHALWQRLGPNSRFRKAGVDSNNLDDPNYTWFKFDLYELMAYLPATNSIFWQWFRDSILLHEASPERRLAVRSMFTSQMPLRLHHRRFRYVDQTWRSLPLTSEVLGRLAELSGSLRQVEPFQRITMRVAFEASATRRPLTCKEQKLGQVRFFWVPQGFSQSGLGWEIFVPPAVPSSSQRKPSLCSRLLSALFLDAEDAFVRAYHKFGGAFKFQLHKVGNNQWLLIALGSELGPLKAKLPEGARELDVQALIAPLERHEANGKSFVQIADQMMNVPTNRTPLKLAD